MSRNQTTSSRSTTVIVKKIRKEKRKRDCELGSKCPYKDEYQHQLEYDHGLVQSEKGKTTKSTSAFRPFGGKCYKLGQSSGI